MVIDMLLALVVAFVPMAAISFAMFYLVDRHVQPEEEENGDEPATIRHRSLGLVHSKWVSFGGGFYGLAALITFIAIEAGEIISFLASATGFQYFIDAISFSMLVAVFMESIRNMITALVWFTYWPDQINIGNGWIWLIMAYAGYRTGALLSNHLAKEE